jgi:Ni/Fe-hydrogenase subunit HybB-like protein
MKTDLLSLARRLRPRHLLLALIFGAGAWATVLRFTRGLGASTNLSDQFPWGIWIGFDVLCGVMLAAGGFSLMAAVHIFHAERFQPIVRPALLTAFLGYLLVVFALFFDLGRGDRIWHPLIMWNPHSVMFEVGWCVMLYTTVLALEFAPIVFEKLRLERPQRWLRALSLPIVIAGVILSTLHQSSLGSLYLIMYGKLHPLWYSPLLPVFFFLSALVIGMAMTIVESSLSARNLGHSLKTPLIVDLGRIMTVLLAMYAVLRAQDLYHRGAWREAFRWGYESSFFWLEIMLALLLPFVLLSFRRVRKSANGLYLVSVLIVAGFITNRLNVAITGMEASAGVRYVPKWTEVAVTISIVAAGILIFAWATKHLHIFHEEPAAAAAHLGAVPAAHAAD